MPVYGYVSGASSKIVNARPCFYVFEYSCTQHSGSLTGSAVRLVHCPGVDGFMGGGRMSVWDGVGCS